MKLPVVTVAIVFKGQIPLLMETIRTLMSSYVSGFNYSLILWDDGSPDSDVDFLYNSIPKNILIAKNANVGYTKAVYNLVEKCKSYQTMDYLLIANSDLKFRTGSFYALVQRMLSNENIGVVGGKILEYDGDNIIHTGTTVNKERDGVRDPYCGLHKHDPRTMHVERRLWVNGCCALYNLNVLRKNNLNFNLDFSPAYFEEADLMTELNVLGHPIMYEPRAEIGHYVNGTMGNDREKYHPIFNENWERYKTKWFPRFKEDVFDFGIK